MINKIVVSDEIKNVCPTFVGAAYEATIKNAPFSESLWNEINCIGKNLCNQLTVDTLKDIPSIAATRCVYKMCGKDPSRYRPAAEALIRRLLKGNELYQIDVAVDLINLASIVFGYSIGGFDAEMIVGDTLTLGVGREGEPYEGIGRGLLNIAGLPVYRDNIGGIGTPTSDHERTKITMTTGRLLVLVNGYDGDEENVLRCANMIRELSQKYLNSSNDKLFIYK